jgi:hypothetical protein
VHKTKSMEIAAKRRARTEGAGRSRITINWCLLDTKIKRRRA